MRECAWNEPSDQYGVRYISEYSLIYESTLNTG